MKELDKAFIKYVITMGTLVLGSLSLLTCVLDNQARSKNKKFALLPNNQGQGDLNKDGIFPDGYTYTIDVAGKRINLEPMYKILEGNETSYRTSAYMKEQQNKGGPYNQVDYDRIQREFVSKLEREVN